MSDQAIKQAWADAIAGLLTEPLSITAWSTLFGLNRNLTSKIVKDTPGAEQCGSLWRIPLLKAPPRYFAERNFLSDAIGCHDLHKKSARNLPSSLTMST